MRRQSFDTDWTFRPKVNPFQEMGGTSVPWSKVAVPHDAMLAEARVPEGAAALGHHPSGTYEYRKFFDVPVELSGHRLTVEFEGVYRDAMVYVNGAFAGHRPYGYSQFHLDIDHLIHFGAENEIRVEARAHADSRWYSGAGIYRRTWLLTGSHLHVVPEGVTITTPDISETAASVVVQTTLAHRSAIPVAATVLTELVDQQGSVVARDALPVTVAGDSPLKVTQRLYVADPQLWDVEAPYLYSCRTSLLVDEDVVEQQTNAFGIRSLSLDSAHGLRINGKTVKLRGACIHHDNGPLGAATIDRAEERRVEILKAAGFNAIRSAHNPMSNAMLDACDRLGMLVMDEAFDVWTSSKSDHDYSASFPEWWQADLEAMVRKDRNHPSVVLYSIGNEIPEIGTAAGAAWCRRLADTIRAADPTRFVTIGVNGLLAAGADLFTSIGVDLSARGDGDAGVNGQMSQMWDWMPMLLQNEVVDRKTAESFAAVDVAGYNYLDSRYEMDGAKYPQRVIVGTETFPTSIDTLWAAVQTMDHVIGDFTWTGWDYLGEAGIGRLGYADDVASEDMPSGLLGSYPWLTAWVGDVDITGRRRPASYYREIVYGLRTDPYIAVQRPSRHGEKITHRTPWSWSDAASSWTWPAFEDMPVVVEVYADADEVELIVAGESIGRMPAGPDARFRAEFTTRYVPGELVAVAFKAGLETGRTSLSTVSGPVALRLEADRTELRSDGSDVAYISVSLADAAGTVDTSSDRLVTVSVEGDGELAGLASGDPRTETSFKASTCSTYEGHAVAVVRPCGVGTTTVTVTAPGCEPQTVTVTAP